MIAFSPTLITISFRLLAAAAIIAGLSLICIDTKFGSFFAITFIISAITIIASLGVGAFQITRRDTSKEIENSYYRYIINAYAKRDTLTPMEITEYNNRLTQLQVFQKQHPECIFHDCDYSAQPFIIVEEN